MHAAQGPLPSIPGGIALGPVRRQASFGKASRVVCSREQSAFIFARRRDQEQNSVQFGGMELNHGRLKDGEMRYGDHELPTPLPDAPHLTRNFFP